MKTALVWTAAVHTTTSTDFRRLDQPVPLGRCALCRCAAVRCAAVRCAAVPLCRCAAVPLCAVLSLAMYQVAATAIGSKSNVQ